MKLIATILILTAPLVSAESHDELIDRAFASIEDNPRERWSFTRADSDAESTSVGHFDPRLTTARQWTLVSIDGRAPNADEVETYRNQRESEEKDESDDTEDYQSIMKEGSVALIDETEEFWLFSFQPVGDTPEDEEFMAHVDGTLKIVKDGEFVAHITLQNSETIKPGAGVKIHEFFTLMEFAPSQPDGIVLLTSMQLSVKGKAMFVVKIDESETITWSGYERVLN
ncbi:MAG: hypothetical protein ACR2QL_06205 [Woeseiaceae bacterium]